MMTRRDLLRLSALAAAGFVFDTDKAFWVPGQRTHILPPLAGWRSATPIAHYATLDVLSPMTGRWISYGAVVPYTVDNGMITALGLPDHLLNRFAGEDIGGLRYRLTGIMP